MRDEIQRSIAQATIFLSVARDLSIIASLFQALAVFIAAFMPTITGDFAILFLDVRQK